MIPKKKGESFPNHQPDEDGARVTIAIMQKKKNTKQHPSPESYPTTSSPDFLWYLRLETIPQIHPFLCGTSSMAPRGLGRFSIGNWACHMIK